MIKRLKKIIKTKSKFKSISIIVIILILGVIIIFNLINSKKYKVENMDNKKYNKIYVNISGEIKYEGIYEFSIDTTLGQALNLIGGVTNKADINNINLNQYLKDNQNILIPCIKESENKINSDEEKINNSKYLVNINKASKTKLMELDGIGEKTAEKIIEYRNINLFKNISELLNVEGIGDSKYEAIKSKISID